MISKIRTDRNRRKKVGIGVGKKFGPAEPVHEPLVHVEFKVGDAVPDPVHLVIVLSVFEKHGRAARELLPRVL